MWPWIIIGYGVFSAVVGGCAGLVAVFCKDQDQRADAFRVFKLVWGTGTGAGGIGAVVLRLSELGVL